MENKNRIALIPTYEPEPILLDLLQELQQHGFICIVINDGSSLEFNEIFEKAQTSAIVLQYGKNYGKGYAIKVGLDYITNYFIDECYIVTVDADGQHKVEDVLKVIQLAEKYPDALILGSRKLQDNVPLRSQIGNTITRYVYRLTTKSFIHDTQTGLRGFSSRHIALLLNISGERYEYEMNVLLECSRRKVEMRETEISTIYIDDNSKSHFNAFMDSCLIYKEIIKFSLSSFVSFLIDYALYSLLIVLTNSFTTKLSITFSNVVARIISSTANYSINRKYVFKSDVSVRKSMIQYYSLALFILICNTFCLNIFVNVFIMNQFVAKIMIEILFFMISWSVQKMVIYRKEV